MKPKDLKSPFPWKKRRVLIKDRVWYVPEYLEQYSDFHFPGWESEEVFGNNQIIHVEFCSGNGSWIAEKAMSNPGINWVAVEIRFDRVQKLWSKIKNHGIKNLFIICGEGMLAASNYFPSSSVEKVYINFPDPWPKEKHAKNRIVQYPFVSEVSRVLVHKGIFTLVTDDPDYSLEMREVVGAHERFNSLFPEPYYVTELQEYGTSYFDQLWREKGRTIHFHQYVGTKDVS